ncbi:MAG: endonuclease/exonuclease/phosphatase family protein [Bacteroidota bacterium]|nr:endonuclease/exonuclease/phosphatase family protein [Bacteroidota bacterium]
MRIIFFIFFAALRLSIFGQNQDILKFVHYNLLYFGATSTTCNGSSNSLSAKKENLATIMEYLKPDIFTVNEIGPGEFLFDEILSGALNTNGEKKYKAANPAINSNLGNMLFYNGNKLKLLAQEEIRNELLSDGTFRGPNIVRLVDVYTLYYRDSVALQREDTTKLHVLVVHLKAGNTTWNKQDRYEAAKAIMKFVELKKTKRDNWFLAGDFNIQSSKEEAYQTLTLNEMQGISFVDPMGSPGNWNNNNLYSNLHTQSTRSSNTNGGCFSGGGLDDRFDFILVGNEVMKGDFGVKYIAQSYRSVGNNGALFNQSIDVSSNNSVPTDVKNALYKLSDHLPVQADFTVQKAKLDLKQVPQKAPSVLVSNPVHFVLNIRMDGKQLESKVLLYNYLGQLTKRFVIPAKEKFFQINVSDCPKGLYTMHIRSGQTLQSKKIMMLHQR